MRLFIISFYNHAFRNKTTYMHDHEDADVLNKLKSIMQNAVNVLTHFMSTSVAFCTDFYTVFYAAHTGFYSGFYCT